MPNQIEEKVVPLLRKMMDYCDEILTQIVIFLDRLQVVLSGPYVVNDELLNEVLKKDFLDLNKYSVNKCMEQLYNIMGKVSVIVGEDCELEIDYNEVILNLESEIQNLYNATIKNELNLVYSDSYSYYCLRQGDRDYSIEKCLIERAKTIRQLLVKNINLTKEMINKFYLFLLESCDKREKNIDIKPEEETKEVYRSMDQEIQKICDIFKSYHNSCKKLAKYYMNIIDMKDAISSKRKEIEKTISIEIGNIDKFPNELNNISLSQATNINGEYVLTFIKKNIMENKKRIKDVIERTNGLVDTHQYVLNYVNGIGMYEKHKDFLGENTEHIEIGVSTIKKEIELLSGEINTKMTEIFELLDEGKSKFYESCMNCSLSHNIFYSSNSCLCNKESHNHTEKDKKKEEKQSSNKKTY